MPANHLNNGHKSSSSKRANGKLQQILANENQLNLLYKFLINFVIGGIWFIIGTRNVWTFCLTTCIWPSLLYIIYLFNNNFMNKRFHENSMARTKYLTFIAQNVAIFFIYFFLNNYWLSQLVTWALRINMIECLLDVIKDKRYLLIIPCTMFIFPYFVNITFPTLMFELHPNYMMVWKETNVWLIINYTTWYISWIVYRNKRITTIMNIIFPLCVPPSLWFAARTFTGSFMLWFGNISIADQFSHHQSITERKIFVGIWDAVFSMIFIAIYLQPYLANIEIV